MMKVLGFILIFNCTFAAADSKKSERGLLPEVQISGGSEDENDSRAIASEILITRSENKAVESLRSILEKKKGSPEEAELWYRLGELYMRRAKSGRFFDLQIDAKSKQLSTFPLPNEKGAAAIKKAIEVYANIEAHFKSYRDMDSVLFNKAFAHQQLGQIREAQNLYEKVVERFAASALVPDSLVALGELYYEQKRFAVAMDYLTRLEKYEGTRVFSYAMYKLAWTHYNMGDTGKGVKRLLQVVELSPLLADGEVNRNRQNLRREALRDLTIFIGDTTPANELVMVFAKITKDDEFGQAMSDLARLYDSHSRFKEMNIFLPEFLRRDPENVYVAKAHLSLVEANEALKNRDAVVEHLKIVSALCQTDSSWRLKHKKEIPDESCGHDFRNTAKDIAEKWWDIWLKNKKHAEFTALTEKALKIIVETEDPSAPDLKIHFAYAELLFALERFDEASDQYKMVSEKMTEDANIKHDATYSALFAKEKSIAKLAGVKSPLKEGERKDLALGYLKKYPHGAQAAEVTFKLAVIFYEEGNYDEAQKWFKPALAGEHGGVLQAKAEDLQLDIYNIKKDFKGIENFAQKILAHTSDGARLKNLNRIQQEASYAAIQDQITRGRKLEAAAQLVAFSSEHSDSKLAPEALWQAVGIYFSENALGLGADTAAAFAEKYPKDSRSADALKEAARTYAENGYLLKAAAIFKKRGETELAADFYALEKRDKEARALYNSLLASADPKTKSRIFSKILSTYPDKTTREYTGLQNSIIVMNIEPYATQILFDKLKSLWSAKKNTEAYELSKKIMSRETSPHFKAGARLIQAKIFEDELVRQSLKSNSEERFPIVLGLKTEKLEKAQIAYLGASKLDPDPQVQLESFAGIDRCYSNYEESLKNIQFPASLSVVDQNNLKIEIGKIVKQIDGKRRENEAQLKISARMKLVEKSKDWNFEEIGAEQSLPPLVHYPAQDFFRPYLPENSEIIFSQLRRLEGRTSTGCSSRPVNSEFKFHAALATCFHTQNVSEMEKIALSLVEVPEQRLAGIYALSLASELQGAFEKSLYFAELGLKSRNDAPLFMYQKARMTYQLEGLAAALPLFDKVLDMQLATVETEVLRGIKSYAQSDYETLILKFSKLNTDQLYKMDAGVLLSDSYAQNGQVDKGLRILEDLLAMSSGNPKMNLEMTLEKARLLEAFKLAPIPALAAYEKARGQAQTPELKDWLDRKLDWLKNQNKGRAAR